jgi:hypothetical protein
MVTASSGIELLFLVKRIPEGDNASISGNVPDAASEANSA